jgi:hypothetical protein
MAFHIVTNKCFLACEKVNSVVLQEIIPDTPPPRKKRKKSKKYSTKKKISAPKLVEVPQQFCITIGYYPQQKTANPNARNEDSEYSLDLTVFSKKEAYALYAEIIKEVQEQHPSEGYLDKLVNSLLESPDFKVGQPEEHEDESDW